MEKKLLERFMKKNCKRQIKHSLELKKEQRNKVINFMLSGKVTIVNLIVELIKKISCYLNELFSRSIQYKS